MKVIDLMCGLGARSIGFVRAGVEVICAVDDNIENSKIYKESLNCDNFIFSKLEDILPEALPDADIIASIIAPPLFSQRGHDVYDNKLNEATYEIISNKKPKCIILEAPISVLSRARREYVDCIMGKYIELGYEIIYNIFSEREYSKYPILGKQLYFVGLRKDVFHNEFYFPEVQSKSLEKDIYIETDVDEWYRRFPFKIERQISLKELYFLYKGELRNVKEIHTGYPKLMYVCDNIGLRRLTHNELAYGKGLKGYNYNKCSNKDRMYRKIASSSNVYLIEAISRVLLNYLLEVDRNITNQAEKRKKKKKKKEIQKVVFPKHKITNINIEYLKGIRNLELTIDNPLTAIMGVNGAGKSTIIHALACIYTPYARGDDYKFSFFFTPNSDFDWKNSKLSITYYDENLQKSFNREYKKGDERWSPRYVDRPKRDTYYIGIETCIPEIEKERQQSFINFSKDIIKDELANRIIRDAAYVLNMDYVTLTTNKTKKKELMGVNTQSGLGYSSLSMGAGEQRILKILKTIHSVDTYSLILIDEIDILLHTTALKRLIEKVYDIALKRKLQIIFTTHSLEIPKLQQFVDVKYIQQTEEKTMVYDYINNDMIYHMSNNVTKEINIYVEDILAKSIIRNIVREIGVIGSVDIIEIGSITNAFLVASSFILRKEDYSNVMVVLDGDRYVTKEEKEKQFGKFLSGTENDHDDKIEKAVSIIKQFSLPPQIPPEKYIYDMLIKSDSNNPIVMHAKTVRAVSESHEWLKELTYRFAESEEWILSEIINLVSQSEEWRVYTKEIREWLLCKKDELKLG